MLDSLPSLGYELAGPTRKALESARWIGKVDVDHGKTGCKTPEAVAAIREGWRKN